MKDTLFDISSDEPVRSRGKGGSRAQALPVVVEQEKPLLNREVQQNRPILPIGMIEHTYDCADAACGTQCHDILHEDRGEWYLSCVFCGTGQWVKAIRGHLKPREEAFVLRDGQRFVGMTLAEVERQPKGPEFIRWAAENHKRDAVRAACKKHMDDKKPTV
jgi:hypothetical protein